MPQGQGFMTAMSWKLAGKVRLPWARLMVTTLSSMRMVFNKGISTQADAIHAQDTAHPVWAVMGQAAGDQPG